MRAAVRVRVRVRGIATDGRPFDLRTVAAADAARVRAELRREASKLEAGSRR